MSTPGGSRSREVVKAEKPALSLIFGGCKPKPVKLQIVDCPCPSPPPAIRRERGDKVTSPNAAEDEKFRGKLKWPPWAKLPGPFEDILRQQGMHLVFIAFMLLQGRS